jgi:transposase
MKTYGTDDHGGRIEGQRSRQGVMGRPRADGRRTWNVILHVLVTGCRWNRPAGDHAHYSKVWRRLRHLLGGLDAARQMVALMLEDFLVSPWCVAVEWPENIAAWLPIGAWPLELGIAQDGRHTVGLR